MEVLGVDIGGSGIKGAPIDTKTGELLAERHRIPTPYPATTKAVTKTLVKLVKHFTWKGKIGCGFPAVIRDKIVRTASNIDKNWIGKNIFELFTNETQCQSYILNDADAAGLAEINFGGGKNYKGVVIIVTVGTGIGTSVFTDGNLLPNTELGHIYMNGKIAEKFASDAVRKEKDLTWGKWAKRFNKYLSELERLFWPDLIIIGGGASKKQEKYFQFLTTKADLITAKLQNEAGMIGAALAAQKLK